MPILTFDQFQAARTRRRMLLAWIGAIGAPLLVGACGFLAAEMPGRSFSEPEAIRHPVRLLWLALATAPAVIGFGAPSCTEVAAYGGAVRRGVAVGAASFTLALGSAWALVAAFLSLKLFCVGLPAIVFALFVNVEGLGFGMYAVVAAAVVCFAGFSAAACFASWAKVTQPPSIDRVLPPSPRRFAVAEFLVAAMMAAGGLALLEPAGIELGVLRFFVVLGAATLLGTGFRRSRGF